MNKNDEVLRHIANVYIEQYGELLTQENQKLEQENIVYPASHVEQRIRKVIAKKKSVRYLSIAVGLAACIAVVFLIRGLPQSGTNSTQKDSTMQGAPNQSNGHSTDASAQEDFGMPNLQSYDVIPLSFVPTDEFIQKSFLQDREKSVYSFENSLGDDVVMTLEYVTGVPNTDRMTILYRTGNDVVVYGETVDGFCLLTFVFDGVLHELTCRYDIDTLFRFASAII